jgi:GxxExxY protein
MSSKASAISVPSPNASNPVSDVTQNSYRGTETLRKELDDINQLTEKIIGCAIEMHRHLGPGLLENTYEEALCIEFDQAKILYRRQLPFPIMYKENTIGEYRLDLLVEDAVIVEIKSVERFDPVFEAQVLTYLRATGKKIGLLINFNSRLLKDGVKRFIL